MTPDEARNLLGGYATGSLTEAERKALFAAALEDQQLFEELAGQQVLKEVVDQPGARQRLIAALERPSHKTVWWMRPWPWAAAAATLAIAIGIVVSQRKPPPPIQIAQVTKTEEAVAIPAAPPPPAKRQIAPAPAPQPPPQLQKQLQKKAEVLADKVEEAKPAPPVRAQEEAQARGGGGRARGFAAAAPAAAALRSENLTVSGFGFNYAIRADGLLEIIPLAPGFLSVATSAVVIFPSGAVSAGSPVRIPIPADSASLVVSFSRTPGGLTGSPVRRDDASGTVTDQDPPNGRIVIELFLKPAPR